MVNRLAAHNNQILFVELAGLLHDIGKLSKQFLEYRQSWQDDPKGYDNDPHDKRYLDQKTTDVIPFDFNKTVKDLGGIDFCEPDFSIRKAVNFHMSPGTGDLITHMLKAADGVDSAIDRNNPLWSAEQKKGKPIFRSNVFGDETWPQIDLDSQDRARLKLYGELKEILPDYFENFNHGNRKRAFDAIEAAFRQGLSDTTRPQNDTTLWEHSYAVASILKVLVVHNLLNEDDRIYKFDKVRFGILGIGWDGMRFLSYGQKIGDITGRKGVIDAVKHALKTLIEVDYPIGNEIYGDDDGIYFIVPKNLRTHLTDLWETIEGEIFSRAAHHSGAELQPHIAEIAETHTLTSLVAVIAKLKKESRYPFDGTSTYFAQFHSHLPSPKPGRTICPICRLRPVERENAKKRLCKTCRLRRTWNDGEHGKEGQAVPAETVFIDEIIDEQGRAALIVARFGLQDWLNGRMVRTLFVTEATGIKAEVAGPPLTAQFRDQEQDIIDFLVGKDYSEFNYHRITKDIDAIYGDNPDLERAMHTAFLYDRRVTSNGQIKRSEEELKKIKENWRKLFEATQTEHRDIDIYNLLNAKSPTPSTILDVWSTTLEFLRVVPVGLAAFLDPRCRLGLKVLPSDKGDIDDWHGGTLEAETVDGRKEFEILYVGRNEIEVIGETYSDESEKEWDAEIRVTDKESRYAGRLFKVVGCSPGAQYRPYRTISVSPNLFMAIVPADKAVEATRSIYWNYIEKFGKVMGRLPFSMGNIFFGKKMPMFVVLDAGKKMISNFDHLVQKGPAQKVEVVANEEDVTDSVRKRFRVECWLNGLGRRTLSWCLPWKLGTMSPDYYHPYFVVEDGRDVQKRSTYFKTTAGDLVHFSQIEPGDALKICPNYYDFEFLDSNTRRHCIHLDGSDRRTSNVANFTSKPVLLDEVCQKINALWDTLGSLEGMTDTKLRNLQSLWLTKYQEWGVDLTRKNTREYDIWMGLVASSLNKEFAGLADPATETLILLQETVANGIFFDALELYLGILKKRIEEKQREG